MANGFVYLWENKINGMMYIGSHKGNIDDGYVGSGIFFKRAYNKNPKNFQRTILYIGNDFIKVENDILKKYDLANNKNFYNLKNEAVGGWEHTHTNKETIKKRASAISKSKKGKRYYHLDYDKSGFNNPMYGKKHNEETRKKISYKLKGNNNKSKKVLEVCSNKIYNSVSDCAKDNNISISTMCVLIRNKEIKRGNCKGKIFRYA